MDKEDWLTEKKRSRWGQFTTIGRGGGDALIVDGLGGLLALAACATGQD